MLIRALTKVMILPEPELQDQAASLSSVTMKRSMNNGVFSYVTRVPDSIFRWQFVLSRAKYYEFMDFIVEHGQTQLRIIDHKDRYLKGHILNDPVTVTWERRGHFDDKISLREEIGTVNIEFRGQYENSI